MAETQPDAAHAPDGLQDKAHTPDDPQGPTRTHDDPQRSRQTGADGHARKKARTHRPTRFLNRPASWTMATHPLARTLTGVLYVVLFCLVNILALDLLQWGINPDRDLLRDYVFSPSLFTEVLFAPRHMFLLNLLLLGLVSLGLLLLFNHFWASTATFL